MIEARDLTRRYGDFTAVEDVSFSVDEGEIVGILGPNGAGKTTTLRMVTGFLPPTRGRLSIGGLDLLDQPVEARRQIGYLPESVALYGDMRVHEYLWYRAMLAGMARAHARRRITEVVEACFLGDVESQIIGTLSKGYRQRVGLAAAIVHEPRVLVLDEPTVGLDPKQIIAIRALIRALGQQQTLLVSSHILPEVELLCNRVIIFDRGRIVGEGSPQDLRSSWQGSKVLKVELKEPEPEAAATLAGLDGVEEVRPGEGGALEIECAADTDPREAIFRAAVERGWVMLELSEQRTSLEEIFVRLTTLEEVSAPTEGAGELEEPS